MIRPLAPADDLFPLIYEWQREGNVAEFGFVIDPVKVEADMRSLAVRGGVCLVMERDNQAVGLMGLTIFTSPFGYEKVANEHCWYVLPEHRGSAVRFISEARKWAKENGCSHLILNASYMASDKCERVTKLYERMGLVPFEHSFIGRV